MSKTKPPTITTVVRIDEKRQCGFVLLAGGEVQFSAAKVVAPLLFGPDLVGVPVAVDVLQGFFGPQVVRIRAK